MSPGLRHALESAVKTGRVSNSDCACAKLRGRVTAHNGVPDDRGSCAEEPCAEKPARTVSEQRLERRLTRRL
jgi:hypothetical protein